MVDNFRNYDMLQYEIAWYKGHMLNKAHTNERENNLEIKKKKKWKERF